MEANHLLLDYKYREAIIKGKVEDDARIKGRVYVDEGAVIRTGSGDIRKLECRRILGRN